MENTSHTFSNITTSTVIPVSIGVFFDGTNNNKFNSTARKIATHQKDENGNAITLGSAEKNAKATDAYNKHTKDDSSYENDYSNIARMYECTANLKKKYSIYVQGSGSSSYEKENGDIVYDDDASRGGAWGTGSSGIRQHTQYACQEVAKKIAAVMPPKKPNDKTPPPTLRVTIDVYGFSRGAATARNFVFEVHRKLKTKAPDGSAIYGEDAGIIAINSNADKQEYLPADSNPTIMPRGYLGYYLYHPTEKNQTKINLHTDRVEIVFRFAGLYDTVGSYDNTGFFSTEEFRNPYLLDLHYISSVMSNAHILHFTAQDEHREYFALTKLRRANAGMHKEIPFHGVHSDIGGSYEDITQGKPEKSIVYSYGTPTAPWYSSEAKDMAISLVTGGPIVGRLVKYGVLSWAHKKIATDSVEEQKKYLLSQGWFKAGEMVQDGCDLVATRTCIPKKYSYLFLYLMCKYISGEKHWKDKDKAKPWEVTYYDTEEKKIKPVIKFKTLEANCKLKDDKGTFFKGGFKPDINDSIVFEAREVRLGFSPVYAPFSTISPLEQQSLVSAAEWNFATSDMNTTYSGVENPNIRWYDNLFAVLKKLFYEQLHHAITDEQVFHYANTRYNPDKVEKLQGLGRFQTIEEMMDTIDKKLYPDSRGGFLAFRASLADFNKVITEQLYLWALRHRYIHWNSKYNSSTLAGVPVAYPYQPHWGGKMRVREIIE